MRFLSLILAAAFVAVVVADDSICDNDDIPPLACTTDSDCINAGCDGYYCTDIDGIGLKLPYTFCQFAYTD
ncbi:hypothetical protein N7493_006015 [Penicillium malachiteum]|uniref:Extracellular membrane protein CFEM domain-containing protein n=1 Tax=Penicillium malachiteum TaxID=1324776 RepID=A0AAD6MVZ1_9EURO|nr:hypothetical protein N7493_006015 [Penicillium malachiteum]